MSSCSPYVTQDGYDNGLTLMCDECGTDEPVMRKRPSGEKVQSYTVSLPQFIDLVARHYRDH